MQKSFLTVLVLLSGCSSVVTDPLSCPGGWTSAVNDAMVCCPAATPYVASNGLCYESATIAELSMGACASWTSPIGVASIIRFAEADIRLGNTYEEELVILAEACEGNADCTSCGLAVLDAVY